MCSFIRLNDAFRKTFPQGSQKNSKTTHFESRGQSNTRADFKLTYREKYGRYEKRFFGGGGGGRGRRDRLMASENFMTIYHGHVETQTMQTADCRLQTVQTVQTVQTECYVFTLP